MTRTANLFSGATRWKASALRHSLISAVALCIFRSAHAQAPAITSISPQSATIGSTITITGSHFFPAASANTVCFNGVQGTVLSASANQLNVAVPPCAGFGPITVTAGGLTAYSLQQFSTSFFSSDVLNMGPQINFLAGPDYITRCAIADLDGDGRPDVVAVNSWSNSISIVPNGCVAGTFDTNLFLLPMSFDTQPWPFAVAIGDLDGDGRPDIVVAYHGNNTGYGTNFISVFQNTSTAGSISFKPRVDISIGNAFFIHSALIYDLDGDGRPDILAGYFVLQNKITNGIIATNSFGPMINLQASAENLAVADLDGDGKPDIIGNGEQLWIVRNLAVPGTLTTSSFAAPVTLSALGGGGNVGGVAVADFDGDGRPDIAAVVSVGTYLRFFKNQSTIGNISSNAFRSSAPIAQLAAGAPIAAGDFNGDGKPDLAVAGVGIYINQSAIGSLDSNSFTQPHPVPMQTECIQVADLDGDGKPDLISGVGTSFSVLRNSSVAAPATIVPVGAKPDGSFTITLASKIHSVYTLENSADFSQWSPLATLTNDTGTISYDDPTAKDGLIRFYRTTSR